MPKVLHILHSLRFSGAEVMLRLAAPTMRGYGFEQHLLADGADVGEYAPAMAEQGLQIHHVPWPYGRFRPQHLWRLYRFLRQHRFDVVHNHTEQSLLQYLLVARLAGVRTLVSTVHGSYEFRGEVRVRRGLYRWLARRLGATFTAIGPSVAAVEQRTFRNPTTLVPNWLDENRFVPARDAAERAAARRRFQVPDGTLALLSVGACSPTKNHAAILHALVALRGRIAAPLLYLHAGHSEHQAGEESLAAQLGVADCVRFVGQLHDVRAALLAADVFVMPSLHEGLGNSLLEALSCGVAAAVYDVYGLRDLVQDRYNGRCVPPTVPALTDALAELLADPGQRHRYGAAARQFVLANYSMHDSLHRLRALYLQQPLPPAPAEATVPAAPVPAATSETSPVTA